MPIKIKRLFHLLKTCHNIFLYPTAYASSGKRLLAKNNNRKSLKTREDR